jgi:hypothetical protein
MLGMQLQTAVTDSQRVSKTHGKLYIGFSCLATDSKYAVSHCP